MHAYLGLDEMAAVPLCGDLQRASIEGHAVIRPDPPHKVLAQDLLEVRARAGNEGRAALEGGLAKLCVVAG